MKYVLIFGLVILGVFLIVLTQIPLGIEPLTEVYIENHTSLPINVFLNKTYNFSFSVHNLEYQDMKYYYNASVFDVNGTFVREIGKGEFILKNNQTETLFQEYKFMKPFERAQIKVVVKKDDMGITPDFKTKLWWPDPNYPTEIDIHFWVDEIIGPRIIIY